MDAVQKQLFMLSGLPGSGKSTWAKKFLEDKDPEEWSLISSDHYIEKFAAENELTYNEAWPLKIKEAEQLMNAQVEIAVIEGKNMLWDQTNLTANSRMSKLRKIPDDYVKVAVYFPTPDNIEERLMSREGKFIRSDIFQGMTKVLSIPELAEGFDIVMDGTEEKVEEAA